MNWGGSVNNAQSFMNGYSMTLGKTGQAILMSDGSYEIDYKGKGKESLISYSFKTQSTGLFEVDVRYSKSTVTKNEIMNYLTANYTYITNQDDVVGTTYLKIPWIGIPTVWLNEQVNF